jgi:hypothetical protein
MLKKPAQYERDTSSANSRISLVKFLPASLIDASAGSCLRPLVNESGMTRSETGTHRIFIKWSQCVDRLKRYHPVTVSRMP